MSDMREVAEAALERVRGRRLQLVTTEHVCSPADLTTLRTIIATYDAALTAAEALAKAPDPEPEFRSAAGRREAERIAPMQLGYWECESEVHIAHRTRQPLRTATREAIDTVRGGAL